MTMNEKPSFLGMLTATAVAEHRTAMALSTWSKVTEDSQLLAALDQVANTEEEHSVAFINRLAELGFDFVPSPLDEYTDSVMLGVARSVATDVEKFRLLLNYDDSVPAESYGLVRMFDDESLDPETCGLIGRFIAEERVSDVLLRSELHRIVVSEQVATPIADEDKLIAEFASCVEQMTRILEDLKSGRS
jgi:hypothetical protein